MNTRSRKDSIVVLIVPQWEGLQQWVLLKTWSEWEVFIGGKGLYRCHHTAYETSLAEGVQKAMRGQFSDLINL